MFEKFLALFRRKKAEPPKRAPGDVPKPAPGVARAGQPRPAPNNAPPDFGATLMIRRPPLEKTPEAPEQPAAPSDSERKSAP